MVIKSVEHHTFYWGNEMEIKIQSSENSIYNLVFIKALLIKYYIEDLKVEYPLKEQIKKEIVKELQTLEHL